VLQHSLIHKVSVSIACSVKHHSMALNKFVTLSLNSDVHQNKTRLVGAAIKHSDIFDMIFDEFPLGWQ